MGAPTGRGPRKRRQRYPRATSTSRRRQATEHSTGGYRATPTSRDARTAYLGPDIREDQPAAVREGVTRRRLVALTGVCPCGAILRRPTADEHAAAAGQAIRVTVEHEPDCPATDDNLVAAMRGRDA